MWLYLSTFQGGYPVIEAGGTGSDWGCVGEPLVLSCAGCCAVLRQDRVDGRLCCSAVVKPNPPFEHVWVLLLTLEVCSQGTQSGVLPFFLSCFVQLRRKLAMENSLPEGFPSLADGLGDALRRRKGECLGLAPILAVSWVKTLAEFATSEVFASLECSRSFSCSPVWVPLVLPANCKHLLSTGLTRMSPQKVLKIRRWKKSKRGKKKSV